MRDSDTSDAAPVLDTPPPATPPAYASLIDCFPSETRRPCTAAGPSHTHPPARHTDWPSDPKKDSPANRRYITIRRTKRIGGHAGGSHKVSEWVCPARLRSRFGGVGLGPLRSGLGLDPLLSEGGLLLRGLLLDGGAEPSAQASARASSSAFWRARRCSLCSLSSASTRSASMRVSASSAATSAASRPPAVRQR